MHTLQPTNRFSARSRVLLGVVTMSVLLSGCAGPGGGAEEVEAATIVDGYDCLAPNLAGWVLPYDSASTPDPQHPDAPAAGRVPEGFSPTTAVRCDLMAGIDDAEGRWSAVTAVTLVGDLTALLTALAVPDDGPWLGPCTADMELVPPLWLVDASGRAINAHYPSDGCGKTKPGVRDALAALTVHETTTLKQTLLETRAALDSGCAMGWTAPLDGVALLTLPTGSFPDADGMSSIPSTPLTITVPTEFDGMRWCRYMVEPDPASAPESNTPESSTPTIPGALTLRTGRFVAGGTLDPASAQLVADLAASEPVPRSCDASTSTFLALWPTQGGNDLGMAFTAELDGCELLYREGAGTRPLPADLHELLSTQTAS